MKTAQKFQLWRLGNEPSGLAELEQLYMWSQRVNKIDIL